MKAYLPEGHDGQGRMRAAPLWHSGGFRCPTTKPTAKDKQGKVEQLRDSSELSWGLAGKLEVERQGE